MRKRLIPKGQNHLKMFAPDMSNEQKTSSTYIVRDSQPLVQYKPYNEPVAEAQNGKFTVHLPDKATVSYRKLVANRGKTDELRLQEYTNNAIAQAQSQLDNDPVSKFAKTAGDILYETRHMVPAMLMATKIPLFFGAGAAWEGANLAYDAYHNDTPGMYRSVFEPAGFAVLDAAVNPATWQFLGNTAKRAGSYIYNRAVNPVALYVNNRVVTLLIVPSSSIFTKGEPFTSELDWSPESWLGGRVGIGYDAEDVAALESHIPEYREIERLAKENGTWLKMPDGFVWKGDPRSWVLMLSKAYRAYDPKDEIWYHGERFDRGNAKDIVEGKHFMWGSSNPYVAETYMDGGGANNHIIPFVTNKDVDIAKDANGNFWGLIGKNEKGLDISTNDFVLANSTDDNIVMINNVIDPGAPSYIVNRWKYLKQIDPSIPKDLKTFLKKFYLGDDIVLGKNVSRKALIGNNGNFDLSNPNIYKILLPTLIGTKTLLSTEKNNVFNSNTH